MDELLLGVDIGTMSSKAVLARPDGTVVATATRQHTLSLPHPGWAEHDAEAIWWYDVRSLIAEMARVGGKAIRAVCASGIGPTFLPADATGTPLRPAILYGIDTRAESQIRYLNRQIGAERILARCGSPLTSQAIGPKIFWVRRQEPVVWARTRRWFMANSFVVHRLTGAYVLDHVSASQSPPLYDLHRRDWITEWVREVCPDLELPHLVSPGEIAGTVTPEAARATGLPAGIPVAAGTIDAWAEATSVGVRAPGDTMVMYGTTMFVVEVVDRPVVDRRMWASIGVFPGTLNLAAGMATSGALTGWVRDLAGGVPFETLLAEAAASGPGAGGIVALPYFAGERTPLFDPDARGVIAGLTLRHGRGDLYRAMLEGTAFALRHNLEVMRAIGGGGRRLIAVGGGTRGDLWTQIVSDVTGRPQEIPRQTIGAAYGDALLAGHASGLVSPESTWATIDHVVTPRDEVRRLYDDLYDRYRALGQTTRRTQHRLAALQRRAERIREETDR